MRMTLRHLAAVTTLVLSAACKGDEVNPATTGPNDDSRLTLVLSSETDSVPEGSSKQLIARVTDQSGNLQATNVTWSSTDPNVASVSNGTVTGVSLGEASIIAYAKGAADTALVVVTPNDLMLDVQPSGAMVVLGDTVEFSATVRDRLGGVVAVQSFNWSVSDSTAATIVGPGTVVTAAEGEITVGAEAMQRWGASKIWVYRSPVYSVTITPGTANVNKGGSLTLEATLRDQTGRIVKDRVTWGSSDFSKVKVSQDGVVTGIAVGSAVITGTSDGRTGSATINVLSAPAAAVNVSFPSTTLGVGSTMQAVATPVDAAGQPLTGKTIAWQSANPSIATVTNTGLVKGIAVGSTNISAIVDGIIKSTRIDVTAQTAMTLVINTKSPSVSIGQQSQLDADVLDQSGVQVNQSISWTSSNPGVASVSSTGMLQGIAGGTATITASSGNLSATTIATVTNVPTASVRITPSSLTLTAGSTGSLVAQALDAGQNVLNGRIVAWTTQNASIATVSNAGLVTAVNAGSTTLTATIEGKAATATVTVNPAPVASVASVTVQLAHTTLNPTQSTNATATLRDASGNTVTGQPVTWSSLDATVATVTSSGVVTAIGGGTVAILAQSGNVTGSASLTVTTPTAAPVARIDIVCSTQDLTVGQTVQPTVTLYDANSNVLTGRTITYSTENPSVISVSATGKITAMGAGTTRMKVTSGSVSAYETFRVTGSTSTVVASVTVSPATSSLTVGGTQQASAVAKDANGAIISGTSFAWTTSNASVASVSSSGLVSAVGSGTATITAAGGGKTGSMSVSVTAAPTSPSVTKSVQVTLSTSSILVGATAQATAIAKDAGGVTISGKSFTWSVGGSSLAQVSSGGLVTAVGAGTVNVTATVDGISGSATLTIAAAPTNPLPPSTGASPAALPKVFLNYSYPAVTGRTITVAAGGDFQAALNTAQRGDEIVLASGATFTGNYTLPAKSGTAANGWIVIRSDKLGQLPAMGTRVTSAQASLMPKIVTPNTGPALRTGVASHGWWLAGLDITISSSVTTQNYGIIFLGDTGPQQNTLSQVPHDIVLDRMYVHGQSNSNLSRCIALNSGRTQITDSYIMECHGKGFDSQAILGWNGPGPYKIVNNTLQGAGENIMFGGADPNIPGVVPSDIEIRRNYIYTPASWKGIWTKKNLLELKSAVRVLIEANVMEGSWTDGQTGWAMLLRSSNQGGACRWCRTTDVTLRKNYITNVGAGVNFIGGDNNGTDTLTSRLYVSELVVDNIAMNGFAGEQRGFNFTGGPQDVTVERTVVSGTMNLLGWLDRNTPAKRVTFRDNILGKGLYGMSADATTQGKPSFDIAWLGYSWTNMTLVGASVTSYPTGTTFVSSEGQAPLAAQIRASVQSAVAGVIIP